MIGLRRLLILGGFLTDPTPRPVQRPRSCARHERLDRAARPLVGASNLAHEVRCRARRPYLELAAEAAAPACCTIEALARAAALQLANPSHPLLHYYPSTAE